MINNIPPKKCKCRTHQRDIISSSIYHLLSLNKSKYRWQTPLEIGSRLNKFYKATTKQNVFATIYFAMIYFLASASYIPDFAIEAPKIFKDIK